VPTGYFLFSFVGGGRGVGSCKIKIANKKMFNLFNTIFTPCPRIFRTGE
jgi:hypothetical protein